MTKKQAPYPNTLFIVTCPVSFKKAKNVLSSQLVWIPKPTVLLEQVPQHSFFQHLEWTRGESTPQDLAQWLELYLESKGLSLKDAEALLAKVDMEFPLLPRLEYN